MIPPTEELLCKFLSPSQQRLSQNIGQSNSLYDRGKSETHQGEGLVRRQLISDWNLILLLFPDGVDIKHSQVIQTDVFLRVPGEDAPNSHQVPCLGELHATQKKRENLFSLRAAGFLRLYNRTLQDFIRETKLSVWRGGQYFCVCGIRLWRQALYTQH